MIRPFEWDGMAGNIGVIWFSEKQKYFFDGDWTGQISLIWLRKFIFRRNGFWAAMRGDASLGPCSIGTITVAAVTTDLPVGRARLTRRVQRHLGLQFGNTGRNPRLACFGEALGEFLERPMSGHRFQSGART
jgi:hypothetical protein